MKKNILNCFLFAFCLTLIFSTTFSAVANADHSAKINEHIKMLGSASLKTRIDAAKLITRSGITEPGLYNIINDKLSDGYNTNVMDRDHIDEMAWMCKAPASSGMVEYRTALTQVIENTSDLKLKKHAGQSLEMLQ